ncbi:MAG: Lrp/AsnC family leucine-responsive transcriptional regulator [Parasphingorhabdus sp.]|jgi:Lrp/AsnC family leucine-responsive transcriptional regulator
MNFENNSSHIDRYEEKILEILSVDGRIPVTELAKQIGISKSPCQARLKRLIDNKIILGFRAVLNAKLLNQEHIAFTKVKLSDTRETALLAFNDAVGKIPEIEQCHMIAGSFDYLLKVRSTDIRTYRRILGETISALPHVANTST